MIVLKYTYDTSVGEFTPTFNSGYVYTTKTSTSGTLKTVTIESDTAFTGLSWGSSSKSSITKIDLVDVSGIKSLAQVFYAFTSLTSVTVVNATTSLLDINHAFYGNTVLTDITFVDCDFTAVNNMTNCFNGGANSSATDVTFTNVKFNNVSKGMIRGLCVATNMKIENCDFSQATNMNAAFASCVGLTGTLDLSTTPFSPNVTDMSVMFSGCSNLKKIIMPKGDFPLLTNMNQVFYRCTNLQEIDFSNFSTKGASITFSQTFGECPVLEEIDLSSLGAIATNCFQIAYGNPNITYSLRKVNLSGLKITSRVNLDHAFYGISTIEWIDISNFHATPSVVTNFSISKDTIKNIGALYCPANVINYYANLMVNNGNVCNIYYHDAKLEDLTVDSRFNYIYCEEYHGDVVSTPDDLELYCNHHYDKNTKTSSPCNQDILDLTTGTITRKNMKIRLNDYLSGNLLSGQSIRIRNHENLMNSIQILFDHYHKNYNLFPSTPVGEVIFTSATGLMSTASQGDYEGWWFPVDGLTQAFSNDVYMVLQVPKTLLDGVDTSSVSALKECLVQQDFTLIMKCQPYTEQLSINPLKSYRNGSITTSSQQLTPTLKTTLPISNKFTTTNLSSGQAYNIYFDGTATKLDAGGTIITNPVSPCEVECGGTALTIEGTDIQNVRVLETTNKNEVGSICGTTDVELSRVIASDLEVITNDIEFNAGTMTNGNVYEIDNELGTINTKGGHSWGAGSFTSNKTYPKGISLLHIEFDVDMPSNNLMAIINFNNNVINNQHSFRDLTLNNDTATIAQGQQSVGSRYTSIVTKGHFSRLMYCFSSQGTIQLDINTGSSAMIPASGNSAEGSTSGYTACANNGVTISNFKIKVIENYPDTTNSSQITSSLRTDNGLTVIWQDMDMSIGQSISTLEQPIKLRSLGTTYDSYNPVTGELVKRIGVSETDGSYSVLSSPIASKVMKIETLTNLFSTDFSLLVTNNYTKLNEDIITHKVETNSYNHLFFNYSKLKPNTVYTVILNVIENNLIFTTSSDEYVISSYVVNDYHLNEINNKVVGYKIGETGIKTFVFITPDSTTLSSLTRNPFLITPYGKLTNQQTIKFKIGMVEGDYSYTDIPYFIDTETLTIPVYPHDTPHLYTNGQVKVYSDSDVYPTTILNGQSTNNYEINELNKSNNYTIRYEGECESINLNGKSNEQGTNRIVKTSTNGSGNLTFINDSGDIDNVLLTQGDVREQEINHFNGLETVEISQIFVGSKQNLFEQYMKADYDYTTWDGLKYSSLHNGVFKCGDRDTSGTNQQKYWAITKPHIESFGHASVYSDAREDEPIMVANKMYHISFSMTVTDSSGGHNYYLQCYGGDNGKGNILKWIKPDNRQADLGVYTPSGGGTVTQHISQEVWCEKDVNCIAMYSPYSGGWEFDCTITDLTICEPENAKPNVPLVYEYIDLPQPVQLNSLPGGTCDTYNPITGEYVQNVGYFVLDDTFASCWRIVKTKDGKPFAQRDLSTQAPHYSTLVENYSFPAKLYDYQTGTKAIANIPLVDSIDHTSLNVVTPSLYGDTYFGNYFIKIALPFTPNDINEWNYSNTQVNDWLRENPIHIVYKRTEPITTQLTPITIPTFEGGILQLITTDGKVFPMVEYSMPTNNRYDTSSWETGAVYTQRNMTEAYFNESTTPMTPTETMTLTTDHISSGSIILNDNGNGLIVLKGNYTGRDIPYFTGMRSVEAIEVETAPSPDQPLFGKGGRK